MSKFEMITVECKDHITHITLNRPAVLNAINPEMHAELQNSFDEFAGDDEQWICIIKGAGERAFSAGSDLKAIAKAGSKRQPYPKNGYAGLIERFDLDKPLIAAVDGVAVGGGFEIALACDLIIATTRSKFGLPEPLIGAVALGGGVHRLARQIGLKQAMGLVLSGESVDAHRAYELGILTELVEPDALESSVDRWCRKILRCAPLAVRASKEAMMKGLDEPSLASAMKAQESYPTFARMQKSHDRKEGPAAFSEKRQANWTGS